MALYTTYDQVGKKEDVSDVISNLSPTKTPFLSGIGNDKCDAKVFDWQEDAFRAAATNAQLEGFTAADATLAATSIRSNVTQILSETIKVAGTSDAIATYGRAKESAYQIAKTATQLKLDLEYAYVGSAQAKVTPSDNLTARKMAGYQAQLLNGGSAVLDADDFVLYTGGSTTLPTEANVLSVLSHLFTYGADPSVISVTPTNSLEVANFAKAAGRYRTINSSGSMKDQKTVVNTVDLYVSPFGEQRVLINRNQKSTNTLIYDPEMWKKVTLRPWFRETLAKTGDNVSMMIVGEFSLKHKNFKASAAIVQAAGATGF